MSLKSIKNDDYIIGKFNESELSFLTNYFLGFGEHIKILEPEQLKEEYVNKLHDILDSY